MDRDPALIDRLERLYPAVVSDCLDRLGLRAQVLDPGIRPLYAGAKVAGYAATMHCVEADAYTRDTLALIEMGFPTFAAGIHCADSLGRIDVDAVGVPISCGGVDVAPGDLVLGDHDRVVVVP